MLAIEATTSDIILEGGGCFRLTIMECRKAAINSKPWKKMLLSICLLCYRV